MSLLPSGGAQRVGWYRRCRPTDLGAVLVTGLAPGAFAGRFPGLGGMLVAVALLLALAHEDVWLEKRGSEVLFIHEWWLFGTRRRRATPLRPDRVVLERGARAWLGRRSIVLALEGFGKRAATLERWGGMPFQEICALSVATGLARWLGLPIVGDLSSDALAWPFLPRAGLRACLERIELSGTSIATDADPPEASGGCVLVGRRARFEPCFGLWLIVEGMALMLVSTARAHGWDRIVVAAALPLGALLAVEGLRRALPGKVVTQLDAQALRVERRGLSRELRLHIPFSDVTWVEADAAREVRSYRGFETLPDRLRLRLGDCEVLVTARELGVSPAEFRWFRGAYANAFIGWLDRQGATPSEASERPDAPHAHRPRAISPPPEAVAPPPASVSYADARLYAGTPLSVFGSTLPGLATCAAVGILANALLLGRALGRRIGSDATQLQLGPPSVPLYVLRGMAVVVGALAAVTLVFAAIELLRSAETFSHAMRLVGIPILVGPVLTIPVVLSVGEAFVLGARMTDRANLCGGRASQRQYAVDASDDTHIRYGPYEYRYVPSSKGGGEGAVWFTRIRDRVRSGGMDSLLEVRGRFGGLYLVVSDEYKVSCQTWQSTFSAVSEIR